MSEEKKILSYNQVRTRMRKFFEGSVGAEHKKNIVEEVIETMSQSYPEGADSEAFETLLRRLTSDFHMMPQIFHYLIDYWMSEHQGEEKHDFGYSFSSSQLLVGKQPEKICGTLDPISNEEAPVKSSEWQPRMSPLTFSDGDEIVEDFILEMNQKERKWGRLALREWFVSQQELIEFQPVVECKGPLRINHPELHSISLDKIEKCHKEYEGLHYNYVFTPQSRRLAYLASNEIWSSWRRSYEPTLIVRDARVTNRVDVRALKTMHGMFSTPLRRDFTTGLPIYVTEGKATFPGARTRSSTYKKEEEYTSVHLYGDKGCTPTFDSKPVLLHAWTSKQNHDKEFKQRFGYCPPAFSHVYYMYGQWVFDHWFSRLSYSIPNNDKKMAQYMSYVEYYWNWMEECRTSTESCVYYDKSDLSKRFRVLFDIVLRQEHFVFFDIESDGRCGVMHMNKKGSGMYQLFFEDSPVIDFSACYVKGGTRERQFLGESVAVIDLDAVIPWTPEPKGLHSTFGGVLQMALRVIMIQTGAHGSPFEFSQFASLIIASKSGRLPSLKMGVCVSDAIEVSTGIEMT